MEPIAETIPPPPPPSWLGGMAGTGKILGDIVSPASAEEDWDALR